MQNEKRQDGNPVWVTNHESFALVRVELKSSAEGSYNEAWLQHLLHNHPSILPLLKIEPSLGRATAVCRELPLAFGAGRTGALDNVLVTETGSLVLVETKLWRNPEARRAVVAQAMEYSAAVFRMGYEEFERAVQKARETAGESTASLYELAGLKGDLDEASFVDAVTRNLRRGRALVAVVGDGIREDILPLAELLQAHAGLRFTFVLVELAVYAAPGGGTLVVPSVLAQTTLIERGVISIREAPDMERRILVEAPASGSAPAKSVRAIGIGEDEFYDLLDQREPGLSALLKTFLERIDTLGMFVDRQKGLNLKHKSLAGHPLNLAAITKDGFVDTGPATWWDRNEAGRRYNDALAAAIGGTVNTMQEKNSALRTKTGKTPRLTDLLPVHSDAWLSAMEAYIAELTKEESTAGN